MSVQLLNIGKPWLTEEAIALLEELAPFKRVLEFGSGGSTVFFAKRAKSVISIEHDEKWFDLVEDKLVEEKISNVEHILIPRYEGDNVIPRKDGYVKVISGIEGSFDLILVDGRERGVCIRDSCSMMEPGKYLILDNYQMDKYQKAIKGFIPGWEFTPFNSKTRKWKGLGTAFYQKPGIMQNLAQAKEQYPYFDEFKDEIARIMVWHKRLSKDEAYKIAAFNKVKGENK
jgi:precorrin-6B methylase 2